MTSKRSPLDNLPATSETLARLLELRRLAAEREQRERPCDPVEFVLVTPKPRPEWGDPLDYDHRAVVTPPKKPAPGDDDDPPPAA